MKELPGFASSWERSRSHKKKFRLIATFRDRTCWWHTHFLRNARGLAFNNLYGQDLYGQDLYGVSKISKVVDTTFKTFKCLNSKFKKTCLLPPSKLRENHDERFFVYAKWGRWRLKKRHRPKTVRNGLRITKRAFDEFKIRWVPPVPLVYPQPAGLFFLGVFADGKKPSGSACIDASRLIF